MQSVEDGKNKGKFKTWLSACNLFRSMSVNKPKPQQIYKGVLNVLTDMLTKTATQFMASVNGSLAQLRIVALIKNVERNIIIYFIVPIMLMQINLIGNKGYDFFQKDMDMDNILVDIILGTL